MSLIWPSGTKIIINQQKTSIRRSTQIGRILDELSLLSLAGVTDQTRTQAPANPAVNQSSGYSYNFFHQRGQEQKNFLTANKKEIRG